MTSDWQMMKVENFIEFNPRLSIKQGTMATKVSMDKLQPFTKFIMQAEKAIFSSGSRFCNGDIILARITPCLENGKTAFVDILAENEIAFGSTEFIVLRAKEGISDSQYVYYLAISPKFRDIAIKSMVGSSGRQRVQIDVLKNLELKLPSLIIQKKIGKILANIDKKIALNQKINDNLQQQATTLFNQFYDQAQIEISFTDVIRILGGGTPKTSERSYWNGNVPFFTPKDVGSPYTLITEKTITKEGLAHCNSRLYPIHTVFVTARGTVGKIGIAGVPMAMNQSCYALFGKDINQLLVYFYTRKVVDRLKHKANGAVFDAITTRDFESESIRMLTNDSVKTFLDVVEPMYQVLLSNNIENLRLAALRDSLLPKLISGEIDVSSIHF